MSETTTRGFDRAQEGRISRAGLHLASKSTFIEPDMLEFPMRRRA